MDKYDWITTVFSDWAFTFVTSFLYYQDYDTLEEAERNVYRKGMECFGGIIVAQLSRQKSKIFIMN